jgi:hypothetical protein
MKSLINDLYEAFNVSRITNKIVFVFKMFFIHKY